MIKKSLSALTMVPLLIFAQPPQNLIITSGNGTCNITNEDMYKANSRILFIKDHHDNNPIVINLSQSYHVGKNFFIKIPTDHPLALLQINFIDGKKVYSPACYQVNVSQYQHVTFGNLNNNACECSLT